MFYGRFCAQGRLNGKVKDETPFRYPHTEIGTWVVAISDPTLLDHGGTLLLIATAYIFVQLKT